MHDHSVRRTALEMAGRGLPIAVVARTLGVSRAAAREWARDPERALSSRVGSLCFVCAEQACPAPGIYGYLLGQYLGDGYLVTSARVPKLRVACADAYPEVAAEVSAAMTAMSGNPSGAVQQTGCTDRYNYWNHWPCLFPQHGPGRKHERTIRLEPWQQAIVAEQPWPLIRGLIHSDGCRVTNRVVVRGVRYSYPRYFFSNESADIRQIMGDALDRVGVAWRANRRNCLSVARGDAVAAMDAHVGPKR